MVFPILSERKLKPVRSIGTAFIQPTDEHFSYSQTCLCVENVFYTFSIVEDFLLFSVGAWIYSTYLSLQKWAQQSQMLLEKPGPSATICIFESGHISYFFSIIFLTRWCMFATILNRKYDNLFCFVSVSIPSKRYLAFRPACPRGDLDNSAHSISARLFCCRLGKERDEQRLKTKRKTKTNGEPDSIRSRHSDVIRIRGTISPAEQQLITIITRFSFFVYHTYIDRY